MLVLSLLVELFKITLDKVITFDLYIVTTIFICSKRVQQILEKVCKEIKIGLVPLLLKLIKQLGTW